MGFYMGPIWATHMGLGWDLQHGSTWYPHGQTHMGRKWESYGSYSGFGPSGPCPANLCRIDFLFNSQYFCFIEYFNSFHKAVEDVKCAEMHK